MSVQEAAGRITVPVMAEMQITAEPKIDTYPPGKHVVLSWTKPANPSTTKWHEVQNDAAAQPVDAPTVSVTVPEGNGPVLVKITGMGASDPNLAHW